MEPDKSFEFLNSEVWLKYTQERYLTLKQIWYRLDQIGITQNEWEYTKEKIVTHRKVSSIPFLLKSINQQFWYFPSDSVTKKISQIEIKGQELLNQISTQGQFKKEFMVNSAIEEAISSAIYEGANTTRLKAKEFIASEKEPDSKDEQMLINNYWAMKWIKSNYHENISTSTVLKIHKTVTDKTLDDDIAKFAGVFRDGPVYVGKDHEGVQVNKIQECIEETIKMITGHPRYLHGLLKGILFHYFVAYIHPFFDGNGRTARIMFYMKAIKNNLPFVDLLSISANLKEKGKSYEKSFEQVVENDNDLTYFVDFCLDSLISALENVEKKVNYLISIALLEDAESLSPTQIRLLQSKALNKFSKISIEEYASDIGKSREIARRELNDLVQKNLFTSIKQGKKYMFRVDSKELKLRVKNLLPKNS